MYNNNKVLPTIKAFVIIVRKSHFFLYMMRLKESCASFVRFIYTVMKKYSHNTSAEETQSSFVKVGVMIDKLDLFAHVDWLVQCCPLVALRTHCRCLQRFTSCF